MDLAYCLNEVSGISQLLKVKHELMQMVNKGPE